MLINCVQQKSDNPRNVWKRRTIKQVGLPIVQLCDFYVQGHESDEDRLFGPWYFANQQLLDGKDAEYMRLRNGIPGIDRYVNTLAVGTSSQELEQLSYVFDEMVMLTLKDIRIEVRKEDVSVKEKMPELPVTVAGRIHLGGEIRLLSDAVLTNFEAGLIWMYRVLRLQEVSERNRSSAPIEWRRSKEVIEFFMQMIDRAAFSGSGDRMRRLWAFFHTWLELDVHREIFEWNCYTWKYVSRLLLGARAYCRVIQFNREETSLFQSAVLSPRDRGLLH